MSVYLELLNNTRWSPLPSEMCGAYGDVGLVFVSIYPRRFGIGSMKSSQLLWNFQCFAVQSRYSLVSREPSTARSGRYTNCGDVRTKLVISSHSLTHDSFLEYLILVR